MKKIVILLPLLLLLTVCSQAQTKALSNELSISGVFKTNYKKYEKDTPITLTRVIYTSDPARAETSGTFLNAKVDEQQILIPTKNAYKFLEFAPTTTEEFWLCEYLDNKMFDLYRRKGYRNNIRKDLMKEADDYVNSISNALYKDAYIQDYVRNIFIGIAPQQLDGKRPERLRVEVLQSPNPDAYMLPNGTLIISTGLLSTIDSVEELTALIASEMAHYALDDHVRSIVKERARVRKANAWGIALGVAAVTTEAVLAYNHEHYAPGGIMLTAGVAGIAMSGAAIEKMGMGYSDEQFFKADQIALKFLEMNNMNTLALGSALHKIATYYKIEKDDYALSAAGGYGNVYKRIRQLGEIKDVGNRSFQKAMSGVTTTNAIIQLNNQNYQAAERLVWKNMENNFATDEDILVWVKANMSYNHSPEDNMKNLNMLRTARENFKSTNLGIYKQEILLLLRMQKQAEATEALKEYITMLNDFKEQPLSNDDVMWANEEISWASKLYQQSRLF